jgi:8-oxo-dGTP diphosphatase
VPDLTDVPVFGHRVEGCLYIVRPSAYSLVQNVGGEVAVVRTPRGIFLPGGGIEVGESPEQAIEREAVEECGLILLAARLIGTAVEIVHSVAENACFEKRSTFFEARLHGLTPAQELDHELVWLQPDEAIEWLSYESHRWAVRRLGLP